MRGGDERKARGIDVGSSSRSRAHTRSLIHTYLGVCLLLAALARVVSVSIVSSVSEGHAEGGHDVGGEAGLRFLRPRQGSEVAEGDPVQVCCGRVP